MTKILSKDDILGALDLQSEQVNVPEWGGAVPIGVMSGAARDAILDMQRSEGVTLSEFQARVLAATIVDEAGQPMFSADDVACLRAKNHFVLTRLVEVALRVNKLIAGAVEDAKKNSAQTSNDASGSSSASTSESPSES